MQLSMFWSAEHPVRPSALPGSARDWMIRVATSCSPMLQLLGDIGPSGWSGRTCPESFPTIEDAALRAFWHVSPDDGLTSHPGDGDLRESSRASQGLTALHGECLTLSLSEWTGTDALSLSDDGVCSLSDILVTGDVPPRYFLSPKACQGILRRAAGRRKTLPPHLQAALENAVDSAPTTSP